MKKILVWLLVGMLVMMVPGCGLLKGNSSQDKTSEETGKEKTGTQENQDKEDKSKEKKKQDDQTEKSEKSTKKEVKKLNTDSQKQDQKDSKKDKKKDQKENQEDNKKENQKKDFLLPKDEEDYAVVYQELLDRAYGHITRRLVEDDFREGEFGILQAIEAYDGGQGGNEDTSILKAFGYQIKDLSGDGVPELIIADVARTDHQKSYGRCMLALYTCANKQPQLVCESEESSYFCWMNNQQFYYFSNFDVMRPQMGVLKISRDGQTLAFEDFYFLEIKDDKDGSVALYHNKTGDAVISLSQELKVSSEEIDAIWNELSAKIAEFELIPFSAYEGPEERSKLVRIEEATEDLDPREYEFFSADQTEPQTRVLLTAKTRIADFKILKLEFETKANGDLVYHAQEMHTIKNLKPERPLMLELTFYGLYPWYGISYKDKNGVEKTYAIDMSDYDGSIYLWELGK